MPFRSNLDRIDSFFDLSYMQRMTGFAMSLVGGVVMLLLGFTYFPMVLIGMPQKFAFTYAMANVLLLTSSCFMVGPKKQVENMLQRHRALAALAWLASTIGLLYTVWRMRFVLYVGSAFVLQVLSLLMYIGTYLPWGNKWIAWILRSWFSVCSASVRGVCCFCLRRVSGGGAGSSPDATGLAGVV